MDYGLPDKQVIFLKLLLFLKYYDANKKGGLFNRRRGR
jgi:hypothetical protein